MDEDAISRIQEIRLCTTSRHQGSVSDPAAGSWSWFDIVILENPQASTPRVKDGITLVWKSHVNPVQYTTQGHHEGLSFGRDHDIMRFLEVGV